MVMLEKQKAIYVIRKKIKLMVEHMEKNEKLNTHMTEWLKKNYSIDNEIMFIDTITKNPNILADIINYYDSIKNAYEGL